MNQTLGHVALVVRDYNEALTFFTHTLNFRVVQDTRLSEDKRWVLIAPSRISRHKPASGPCRHARAGKPHRQPDGWKSLSFAAY